MGIVAKNIVIVKKEKAEQKQPIAINNFAEWRANQVKQQEVVIENPVVEDTKIDYKRQPSSEWLSIKESDYVSHLIK
tara:strand:- start:3396 stop:3626 length:231 start_codon:yes stop_codon:yes gene_type:complete